MRESLFSPLWHRYAQQRPQLRPNVRVQPQRYRDQIWYLLINDTNGNHYRINNISYQLIGRFNGKYSVQEIWDNVLENYDDEAPTQDDVIRLLIELDQRDLIQYEILPDIQGMFRRKQKNEARKLINFINPLAFRLPLWNPSKFLDSTTWLQTLIFNPITFLVWLAIVITATLTAILNWGELSRHATNHMSTPHYLFIAWLSFPFIKSLHELGHALAVRNWDGQVKEAGITLFMLTPAPYVDASASSAFRSRTQRMIVGAMGIMVELLIAALALAVWFSTQTGLIHDLAFVVMFICSVSSLLFNGNPLLRFDAYYILCDVFDLPNLATRGRLYWTNLIKKWVIGSSNTVPMPLAAGERKWLITYTPLSIAYSLLLFSYIIFWVGEKSAILGLLIAIFVAYSMLIKPIFKTIQNIISSTPVGSLRRRSKLILSSTLILIFTLVFTVPVPYTTLAQGVIWLPEQAHIRPTTDGFIKVILANHGEQVQPNQVIFELEDLSLVAERDMINNKLSSLLANQYSLLLDDPATAASINEQIEKLNADLQHLEKQIDGLKVRSLVKGKLVIAHQNDLIGTYVKRGSVLAHVLSKENIKVRAAVPELDATLIREDLKSVQVIPAELPNRVINARMVMDTPAVTNTLPSPAMGDQGGGLYITDSKDEKGLTSLEPLVLVDLDLPSTNLDRIGGRVDVRFDHGFKPIAVQIYRHLQQVFLIYFNPND